MRWRRFAAVTQIEWQDLNFRSRCLGGMFKVLCVMCCRNMATSEDKIISPHCQLLNLIRHLGGVGRSKKGYEIFTEVMREEMEDLRK